MIDISVIVPMHNVEKYIERCLRSLFNQTKTNGVEFVLIDDCSTDRTMEITQRVIDEFSALNIVTVKNTKNQGIGTVRYIGMSMVKGCYVIHIDGDDWCEPTMLEEMYGKAVEENADIVGCDHYTNYPNEQVYSKNYISDDRIENLKSLLTGRLHGAMWNKMVKRSLYVDNNFSHAKGVNNQGDKALSAKMFYYSTKNVYLPKAFVHYAQRNDSIVHSSVLKRLPHTYTVQMILDEFFAQVGIDEQLKGELLNSRVKLKYNLVAYSHREKQKQKEFLALYPEVDNQIFSSFVTLKLKKKMTLYLATHKALWFANIIFRIFIRLT